MRPAEQGEMGNALADITEDGNVWDEERLKVSEDLMDDGFDEPPTILVAPNAGFESRGLGPAPTWQDVKNGFRAGNKKKPSAATKPDEQVWTIVLDRAEGEKLGLGMRVARNGRLEITCVEEEGLIAAWNVASPLCAIRAGDRIMEVNGESTKEAICHSLLGTSKLTVIMARDEDSAEFDAGVKKPQQVVLQPGCGERQPLTQTSASASSSSSSTVRQQRWKPLNECPGLSAVVLLTPQRLLELHPFLPLTVRFASNWKLIYCPEIHGTSLRTFYRQCQAWPSETLFIIQDTEGAIFGGFASSPWKVSSQKLHYGAPNCFVFSYGLAKENSLLQVYPWAGGNDFFMFADANGFSMGGGRKYAVWVDKEFLRGTSSASSTFGNEGPIASREDFVIQHFECWAFDSDNFGSSLSQALIRENRAGLREGSEALAAAFDGSPDLDGESLAQAEFVAQERRRGLRDIELREYASQASRFEAIS